MTSVLVQQRDQRVEVVALERIDVAGQQRLLLVIGLVPHVPRLEFVLGEGRPRPLEGAVDRLDARAQQLGDFRRVPPQHLAQDQDGPLAGRKDLECGDEGKTDRLAQDGLFGGIIRGREHLDVGRRLDPRGLREWG